MRFEELTAGLAGERLGPPLNPVIQRIRVDSRQVAPGDLFVAQVWPAYDASPFVAHALEQGAVALVVQRDGALPAGFLESPEAPVLVVEQVRAALAALANRFNGYPTRELTVVAVTGTNGKTTTALLLEGIFGADERLCGVIGTLFFRLGGWEIHGRHTTPQADQLFALLRTYIERGAQVAVMEASSHGLALQRLDGVLVDVAVFTNLSHEHLDFHGDLEGYFAAKRRLFTEFLPTARAAGKPGVAVINADDPRGRALADELEGPVIRYGLDQPAEVSAREVRLSASGTGFELLLPGGRRQPVRLGLVGRHNVSNALAAAAAAEALGVSAERIAAGLEGVPAVRGRLERVWPSAAGGGAAASAAPAVFVDYAHTPEALAYTLETLRELSRGRLLVAFGCGGDRDPSKRPLMGQVAARGADHVVVTSDNPRSEDPLRIAEAVLEGARAVEGGAQTIGLELDRRRAIFAVVAAAGADDIVLIAGKGHETSQEMAGQSQPFDDVQVAREALRAGAAPAGGLP